MARVLESPSLAKQTPLYQDPSAPMKKRIDYLLARINLEERISSADQPPPFTDYSMKGRTYRFFTGEPLYPFGYGLSYTTFAYRNLVLPAQAKVGDTVSAAVEVRNTGTRAGEEVVPLYLRASGAVGPAPLSWLAGFERVALRAGDTKQVGFALSARQFSAVQANGRRTVQPGTFEIPVDGKQPGGLEAATTQEVTGKVQIAGEPKELN